MPRTVVSGLCVQPPVHMRLHRGGCDHRREQVQHHLQPVGYVVTGGLMTGLELLDLRRVERPTI